MKELWQDSLIIGILSGLICALLTWILRPVPRLRILKEVAFDKEKTKYQFKIQNRGCFDIGISSIHITLCFKGQFYNIKGNVIPFIHSEKNAKKTKSKYTYERLVSINVSHIKPEAISKSEDEELIKKCESGKLVLHDFIKKDENLRIYVGLMAISYRFNTTKYYKATLTQWTEGEYSPGKCVVENAKTPTES